MPTYYLYPKAISLDEITFKKTDVEIGTAQFTQSDFSRFLNSVL